MTKAKSLILGLITLILLVSCVRTSIESNICKLPSNATNSSSRSDNLTISVYVDGTPSMEGYVNPQGSRYKETLKILDNQFYLNSKKLNYNRLGTNIQQIPREQFITDALESKFYSGNDKYSSLSVSQIEKAIKPGKDNQMSVIITDLYQKNSDVTKVNREIQNNYLNSDLVDKGYAVGVIAVKSQFEGNVYTEVSDTSFPYNTQGKKPNRYHPFYVIFLGKYSDINYYFNKLSKEKLIKDSKLVIFSPRSILKETLQFPKIKNSPPFSLNTNKVRIERKGYPFELLEVSIRDKNKISQDYEVSASYSKYSLPFQTSSIETRITIEDANKYLKKNYQRNIENRTNTDNQIKISEFKLDKEQQKFKFTTTIQPKNIKPNKIHIITADVIATELEEPTWWEEWSSTESNLTDGSKTYNLTTFFRGLKDITTELMTQNNSQSNIGLFCYAIQKK